MIYIDAAENITVGDKNTPFIGSHTFDGCYEITDFRKYFLTLDAGSVYGLANCGKITNVKQTGGFTSGRVGYYNINFTNSTYLTSHFLDNSIEDSTTAPDSDCATGIPSNNSSSTTDTTTGSINAFDRFLDRENPLHFERDFFINTLQNIRVNNTSRY
jgi:hypothetical protein